MATPSDPQPKTSLHPTIRTVWRVFSWAVRLVLLGALTLAALSPALVTRDWRFDIVANLLAQIALAGFILTGWQFVFRRWIWGVLFLVVTIAACSWIIRVERAKSHHGPASVQRFSLRLHTMNVYSRNDDHEQIIRRVLDIDADATVLVESSIGLLRAVSEHPELISRYPYRADLGMNHPGQIIVLSKYTMSSRPHRAGAQDLASSWGYRAGYLDLSGTSLRFAAVHAPSPRTEMTWGFGRMTFDRLGSYFERTGFAIGVDSIPTVIIGDLNCSPTSARSLHVNEHLGLLRAKPLTVWDGTFPSGLPWFARSSIDGAFVSPDVRVVNWRTVDVPGSDHRGVVLEISVPSSSTGTSVSPTSVGSP